MEAVKYLLAQHFPVGKLPYHWDILLGFLTKNQVEETIRVEACVNMLRFLQNDLGRPVRDDMWWAVKTRSIEIVRCMHTLGCSPAEDRLAGSVMEYYNYEVSVVSEINSWCQKTKKKSSCIKVRVHVFVAALPQTKTDRRQMRSNTTLIGFRIVEILRYVGDEISG